MDNDFIAALPTAGEADRALLRAANINRPGYALSEAEDPTDLVALDPDTGAIPQFLVWHETIFYLDPDDATTAHDGLTTLVTADAYRYKANDLDARIRAVLDRDLASDPASGLEIGDAYLVPAGATGEWAGEAESIAVYTARGWQFRDPVIGEWLYIEDEDAYARYTAAGVWTLGQGGSTFAANSIPVSAIINAARTSFIVENQTTNAPPGSPSVGVAYIIGPSPTGLWAGKAAQVAVWETSGAADWTYYVPTNGFQSYDKSLNIPVRFNGTAWISAAGAIVHADSVATISGSTTAAGSGSYTYSDTVAPANQIHRKDDVGLTYAAQRVGAVLTFTYRAKHAPESVVAIALYRDAETTALDWHVAAGGVALELQISNFRTVSTDVNPHTYYIKAFSGTTPAAPTRRLFSLMASA